MRELISPTERSAMLANGRRSAAGEDLDPYPVVKLFLPGTAAIWLLTELDPLDPDIAFGLCDLGMGFPELGSVRLSELSSVLDSLGNGVTADRQFSAAKPLSAYTTIAQTHRAIQA